MGVCSADDWGLCCSCNSCHTAQHSCLSTAPGLHPGWHNAWQHCQLLRMTSAPQPRPGTCPTCLHSQSLTHPPAHIQPPTALTVHSCTFGGHPSRAMMFMASSRCIIRSSALLYSSSTEACSTGPPRASCTATDTCRGGPDTFGGTYKHVSLR